MTDKFLSSDSRTRDFGWVMVAYGVALAAAWLTVVQVPFTSPLWLAAAADIVATLIIFCFASVFRNSSFYDAYWSVAPPVLVLYWMLSSDSMDLRVGLVFVLVCLWAGRLTHNWARGWQGLAHQDWRYVDLKSQTGPFYPLVDLLGIQMLPTVLVFIGCVPVWLILSNPTPIGWLDLVWLSIGLAAVGLEYRADNVLRAHRLDPSKQGEVLREDVWGWCRHPNYLGELGFWFALGLCAYLGTGLWISWLGFVLMLALFFGVSIPMIDKRQLSSKPAYADYKATVPAILPKFWSGS